MRELYQVSCIHHKELRSVTFVGLTYDEAQFRAYKFRSMGYDVSILQAPSVIEDEVLSYIYWCRRARRWRKYEGTECATMNEFLQFYWQAKYFAAAAMNRARRLKIQQLTRKTQA